MLPCVCSVIDHRWRRSKCGKNKKVANEAIAACVTDVLTAFWRLLWSIREFMKPRRQRQREHRWTKELMNRTMVLHARYNCWYISVSSSSKRRLEMTKFCVVWRTWTTTANFLIFISNLSLCSRFSFAIVLTVINNVNDFTVPRDSWIKHKLIF